MKLLLSISVSVVGTMILFISLMHIAESDTVVVRYDCRQLIGGWHPDVPVTVQEQCRSRRTNASSETRN
jgi:spore maturation protein SpmA